MSSRFDSEREADAAYFEDWSAWPGLVVLDSFSRRIELRPLSTTEVALIQAIPGAEPYRHHRYDSVRCWLVPVRSWRALRARLPRIWQARQTRLAWKRAERERLDRVEHDRKSRDADRYLWHVTPLTAHAQRILRRDQSDAVIAIAAEVLGEARRAGSSRFGPDFRVSLGPAPVRALWCDVRADDRVLASIAVAPISRVSDPLWEILRGQSGSIEVPDGPVNAVTGPPPPPPWCVLRLYPAALSLPDATIRHLGSASVALAWAWIERRA